MYNCASLTNTSLRTFFSQPTSDCPESDFLNIHIQTLGVTPIDAEFERGRFMSRKTSYCTSRFGTVRGRQRKKLRIDNFFLRLDSSSFSSPHPEVTSRVSESHHSTRNSILIISCWVNLVDLRWWERATIKYDKKNCHWSASIWQPVICWDSCADLILHSHGIREIAIQIRFDHHSITMSTFPC